MNVSNQIKNLEKEMGIHKNFWLRKCLFQDKPFQIGKMIKVIRIFIIYLLCVNSSRYL